MRIGFEFCLVMAVSLALVASVSAAPKVPISRPGTGMGIHVNPGGLAPPTVAPPEGVPLTESECEGLGGSVVPDKDICSSGAYCMTEDQAGNRRRVCLTVFVE
jgi:hypothetical protein